jgi:hypothetical protein
MAHEIGVRKMSERPGHFTVDTCLTNEGSGAAFKVRFGVEFHGVRFPYKHAHDDHHTGSVNRVVRAGDRLPADPRRSLRIEVAALTLVGERGAPAPGRVFWLDMRTPKAGSGRRGTPATAPSDSASSGSETVACASGESSADARRRCTTASLWSTRREKSYSTRPRTPTVRRARRAASGQPSASPSSRHPGDPTARAGSSRPTPARERAGAPSPRAQTSTVLCAHGSRRNGPGGCSPRARARDQAWREHPIVAVRPTVRRGARVSRVVSPSRIRVYSALMRIDSIRACALLLRAVAGCELALCCPRSRPRAGPGSGSHRACCAVEAVEGARFPGAKLTTEV